MTKHKSDAYRYNNAKQEVKTFHLALEGNNLEVKYFQHLKKCHKSKKYKIEFINKSSKDNAGAPLQLQRKVKHYIKVNSQTIQSDDEIWIIIDRDNWELEQLQEVQAWCKDNNYGFAISVPKFEFWILLHYEEGSQVTSKECSQRLKKYFSDKYIDLKNIDINFEINDIHNAINRAKKIDNILYSSIYDEIKSQSYTTVYKVVDNILEIH
jgi:hypothetical protein